MSLIENLEKMLAAGQDNALLRYSLGTACQAEGRLDAAILHLEKAVAMDPVYSAAWKAYAKTLDQSGLTDRARRAYLEGIRVARDKGDIQAAKEMQVFLKRLDRKSPQKE